MQHPLTEMRPRQFKLRRQLRRPRERRPRHHRRPRLRFSPTAWAKLLFLRDRGPTEVGGFGITPPDDLLYVQDVRLVRQRCTVVSVAFDDTAVAEFFDEQVDAGRKPEQFARIWIHTHPADSALPSQLDEETCQRVFGGCDWAVMFILARGGQRYCRMQFRAGPGGAFEMPTRVDFEREFPKADLETWAREYATTVRPAKFVEAGTSFDESWIDQPEATGIFTPLDELWDTANPEEESFIT
jgi:proteasome lid subunit RPN8/RPN11